MLVALCGIEMVICDAYIDQGFKIGDDPVGYKCTGLATNKVEEYDLCDTCKEMLQVSPRRVSFSYVKR